jgi:chromosome segregation ATPase
VVYLVQVKDLEQKLSKITDSKTSVEEKLKTSEHFVQSLETELQTTRANLEARQTELKESQDKVRTRATHALFHLSPQSGARNYVKKKGSIFKGPSIEVVGVGGQ